MAGTPWASSRTPPLGTPAAPSSASGRRGRRKPPRLSEGWEILQE